MEDRARVNYLSGGELDPVRQSAVERPRLLVTGKAEPIASRVLQRDRVSGHSSISH